MGKKLCQLNLFSLERRRLRADLILAFKIEFNFSPSEFLLRPPGAGLWGHTYRISTGCNVTNTQRHICQPLAIWMPGESSRSWNGKALSLLALEILNEILISFANDLKCSLRFPLEYWGTTRRWVCTSCTYPFFWLLTHNIGVTYAFHAVILAFQETMLYHVPTRTGTNWTMSWNCRSVNMHVIFYIIFETRDLEIPALGCRYKAGVPSLLEKKVDRSFTKAWEMDVIFHEGLWAYALLTKTPQLASELKTAWNAGVLHIFSLRFQHFMINIWKQGYTVYQRDEACL